MINLSSRISIAISVYLAAAAFAFIATPLAKVQHSAASVAAGQAAMVIPEIDLATLPAAPENPAGGYVEFGD
jgi:hypothetical protein